MTDREIEHRRPDIVVFKKEPGECQLSCNGLGIKTSR